MKFIKLADISETRFNRSLQILMLSILPGFLIAQFSVIAITFSAFFFLITYVLLFKWRPIEDFLFFRPLYCLLALLYLYAVTPLTHFCYCGFEFYPPKSDLYELVIYQCGCLLAAVGFILGTKFAINKKEVLNKLDDSYVTEKTEKILSFSLIGLIFLTTAVSWPYVYKLFSPFEATNYSQVLYSTRVEKMSNPNAGIIEIFFEVLPSMLILFWSIIVVFNKNKNIALRVIGGFLIILYGMTAFASGWRSLVMLLLVIIIIFYHYQVCKLKILQACWVATCLYLIITLMSFVRLTTNPIEMVQVLSNRISTENFKFMSLSKSSELNSSVMYLRLIDGLRTGETDFGYGKVALGQIGAFVPRAIQPDRSPLGSQLYAQTFYPDIYKNGGGFGFFIPLDGYWDFGLLGVLFYCALYAYILEKIFWLLHRSSRATVIVLIYGVLYSQLVVGAMRSGIFASIKASLLLLIPIFIWLIATIILKIVWSALTNRSERNSQSKWS